MIKEANQVMKHTARPWPLRPALFIDVESGVALHENGRSFGGRQTRDGFSLEQILRACTAPGWQEDAPRNVYLVGGWNAAATPESSWFLAPAGWTRTSYNRNPLMASYKRNEDGRRVTIYATAQWFGECPDIALCQKAYTRLRALLRGTFDQGATIMGTPARTGLDLLERSLPRDKAGRPYEYPVLGDDLREKLEHNIGQGRMEMIRPAPGVALVSDEARTLYVQDAIWMYSACLRALPVGPVEYDQANEFAGYRPAFYHVTFRVPHHWRHIGLLPTWNPRQKRPVWPATPSPEKDYTYHGYVTGEELRLALDNGWPVQILERWLFANERVPGADPARQWIEKLQKIRAACTDEREGEIGPLLRSAIRALVLKAIGSLHRRGRYELQETPVEQAEEIPEDAEIIWRDAALWRWRRPIALDKSMLQYQHPEWAAMVWGRARARLAKAALQLPRESIIALRSDAIVTTMDPGWKGSKPGEFRLKEVLRLAPGQSLPRTSREYLDLRAANRLEVEEE